jgi:hypothetical protein
MGDNRISMGRRVMTDDHVWNLARIAARNALAEIGGNQMHTWAALPPMDSPYQIIARHVAEAIKDALPEESAPS